METLLTGAPPNEKPKFGEEQIVSLLQEKLGALFAGPNRSSQFELQWKEFIKTIHHKYNPGQLNQYKLYVSLFGNRGPKKTQPQYFDLPGKDSIENFINNFKEPDIQ